MRSLLSVITVSVFTFLPHDVNTQAVQADTVRQEAYRKCIENSPYISEEVTRAECAGGPSAMLTAQDQLNKRDQIAAASDTATAGNRARYYKRLQAQKPQIAFSSRVKRPLSPVIIRPAPTPRRAVVEELPKAQNATVSPAPLPESSVLNAKVTKPKAQKIVIEELPKAQKATVSPAPLPESSVLNAEITKPKAQKIVIEELPKAQKATVTPDPAPKPRPQYGTLPLRPKEDSPDGYGELPEGYNPDNAPNNYGELPEGYNPDKVDIPANQAVTTRIPTPAPQRIIVEELPKAQQAKVKDAPPKPRPGPQPKKPDENIVKNELDNRFNQPNKGLKPTPPPKPQGPQTPLSELDNRFNQPNKGLKPTPPKPQGPQTPLSELDNRFNQPNKGLKPTPPKPQGPQTPPSELDNRFNQPNKGLKPIPPKPQGPQQATTTAGPVAQNIIIEDLPKAQNATKSSAPKPLVEPPLPPQSILNAQARRSKQTAPDTSHASGKLKANLDDVMPELEDRFKQDKMGLKPIPQQVAPAKNTDPLVPPEAAPPTQTSGAIKEPSPVQPQRKTQKNVIEIINDTKDVKKPEPQAPKKPTQKKIIEIINKSGDSKQQTQPQEKPKPTQKKIVEIIRNTDDVKKATIAQPQRKTQKNAIEIINDTKDIKKQEPQAPKKTTQKKIIEIIRDTDDLKKKAPDEQPQKAKQKTTIEIIDNTDNQVSTTDAGELKEKVIQHENTIKELKKKPAAPEVDNNIKEERLAKRQATAEFKKLTGTPLAKVRAAEAQRAKEKVIAAKVDLLEAQKQKLEQNKDKNRNKITRAEGQIAELKERLAKKKLSAAPAALPQEIIQPAPEAVNKVEAQPQAQATAKEVKNTEPPLPQPQEPQPYDDVIAELQAQNAAKIAAFHENHFPAAQEKPGPHYTKPKKLTTPSKPFKGVYAPNVNVNENSALGIAGVLEDAPSASQTLNTKPGKVTSTTSSSPSTVDFDRSAYEQVERLDDDIEQPQAEETQTPAAEQQSWLGSIASGIGSIFGGGSSTPSQSPKPFIMPEKSAAEKATDRQIRDFLNNNKAPKADPGFVAQNRPKPIATPQQLKPPKPLQPQVQQRPLPETVRNLRQGNKAAKMLRKIIRK